MVLNNSRTLKCAEEWNKAMWRAVEEVECDAKGSAGRECTLWLSLGLGV